MPSDFGDESGEKFCDWLMDIGQQAGEDAMQAAAHKLTIALKKTKGDITDEDVSPMWARLSLDELSQLEGFDNIKQILEAQLNESGVEHSFFIEEKTGKESLLFKHEDAGKVDRVFDELIEDVDKSLTRASAELAKSQEANKAQEKRVERDAEPLDKRVSRVRSSSAALESSHSKERSRDAGREDKFQEVKTK